MMKKMLLSALSCLLALALSFSCAAAETVTTQDASLTHLQIGDFTLKLTDDTSFTLSEQAGKVVLLNFWATWCGPCVMEMPALNDLAAHYADAEDVVILSVNCGDQVDVVRKFLQQKQFDALTVACDTTTYVSYLYGVDAIPRTIIFDKTGSVAVNYVGVPMNPSQLCDHYVELIEAMR